jgi:hypothetical protein
MVNILWIIAAVFVGLWILGGIFALLGFMIHIALILLYYALIIAIVIVIYDFTTRRMKR